MIKVESNYKLVGDLLSKNNGVFISPEEYNSYAKIASEGLFADYVGLNTAKKVGYGRNRTLDSRLTPFRRTVPLTVGPDSEVGYPYDWAKTNKVHTLDYIPIRPLDEDRIAIGHQDPFITGEEWFYEDLNDGMKIFSPDGIVSDPIILTYLKRPDEPKYAYIIGSNGRPEFDPVNSVDFDWDINQEGEITMRILQLCGVSMDKIQAINFGMAKQNEE